MQLMKMEMLIDNMKKMNTEQQQTKSQNMIFIKLVMSFLLLVQEESNILIQSNL